MKFENDVFISYAHLDNAHFTEVKSGWIDLLHERLGVRLTQELGRSVKIWRDRKLGGNDVFNETISGELAKTAVLLSIISPRYLDSPSCLGELAGFFRCAADNGGLVIEHKHRVSRVMKTFVSAYPPGLENVLGYEFYQRDQASGRVREFDDTISSGQDKDQRYWDKFDDLVWDLKELITRLQSPPPDETAGVATSAMTIYLAETTSDLSQERDKVKRELTQYGHLVLPDTALPLEASALQQSVRDYLKRSRLSVHLIGEYYGIIPEKETEKSIVRLQEELAVERGDDAEFSRLVWMPPGLKPQDERQQKFVIELQNSFTSHNGSELLQVKLEDLKTIIQTKLTPKRKNEVAAATQATTMAHLYLICDRQDEDAIETLKKSLFEKGFEVILPLLEGSETDLLNYHKDSLTLCDAVLIFQGRASESWLQMKLRDLLKLAGYGRTTALLGKAVYLGPPESPPKERLLTREATVIRNYGDFDPAIIEPFIDQISKAKEGSS